MQESEYVLCQTSWAGEERALLHTSCRQKHEQDDCQNKLRAYHVEGKKCRVQAMSLSPFHPDGFHHVFSDLWRVVVWVDVQDRSHELAICQIPYDAGADSIQSPRISPCALIDQIVPSKPVQIIYSNRSWSPRSYWDWFRSKIFIASRTKLGTWEVGSRRNGRVKCTKEVYSFTMFLKCKWRAIVETTTWRSGFPSHWFNEHPNSHSRWEPWVAKILLEK